jgi:hypothetical protein
MAFRRMCKLIQLTFLFPRKYVNLLFVCKFFDWQSQIRNHKICNQLGLYWF